MPSTKQYLHDKSILLLLGANYFLAFFSSLVILLRVSSAQTDNYIVQYRPRLGLSAFKTGKLTDILSFVVFAGLVLIIHTALSVRTYHVKRELSLIILGLGVLLLVLATIVSNALLVLR